MLTSTRSEADAGYDRIQSGADTAIGIKVRFADFQTHTRVKTLPEPTDSETAIRKAAFECFARLKLDRRVRLLGVGAGELPRGAD